MMPMFRTTAAVLVAGWLVVAAVPVLAAPPAADASSTGGSAQTYAFVFKDADISQIADEILGNTLNVPYRVEPDVKGKMTLRIEQRLTRTQLMAAFEAALDAYDVVMTQDNGTVVLRARDKAQASGLVHAGGSPRSAVGYQIRAVPVNYGGADEIAKALESVTRAHLVLYSSDKYGLILLGGRQEELDNALTTVAIFDQSTLSGSHIRFFQLANAGATTVAGELQQLLKASGTSSVSLAPLPRLNGLFACSKSPEALEDVAALVTKLDVQSQDPSVKIWVYRPRGVSAESLANTLNLVMGLSTANSGYSPTAASSAVSADSSFSDMSSTSTGKKTAATTTAPIAPIIPVSTSAAAASNTNEDPLTRIVADKETNTVIISAPESIRVRILNVINDIDREPAQVFIEASILEVSLNNDFNYGVDWNFVGSHGLNLSSYSGDSTTFPTMAPGFTVNYVGTDVTAAVRALNSISKVRIVSAPKITAVENTTARLQVGDQVPIVRQSAQATGAGSAPLINSVDYRDTGVKLEVTPRITSDNRVSLSVIQEVSSVAKTQTSGIDSPTISQRRMESKLIIPEGTVVALGGLISTSNSQSDGGVPLAMNVPLVGGLFKGHKTTNDRTELVVLLQVKILRDPTAYGNLLANLGADMNDLIHQGDWLAPAQ